MDTKTDLRSLSPEQLLKMERDYASRGIYFGNCARHSPPIREAAAPQTPAQIYAHYKTLTGDARAAYFERNATALWDHYYATRA